MSMRNLKFIVLIALFFSIGFSFAEDSPRDPLSKIIWEIFQKQQATTMCSVGDNTLETIRANVVDYLKGKGSSETVSSQSVAMALWALYPCPFSPARPELRLATNKDIAGVWLFPESSQKFRFAPQSPLWSSIGPAPVRCDAVGYYPNGELRHAMISGRVECPFKKASDMDIARKNPRVSDWTLLREGRISVTRTDIANHIEEWDVYTVVLPFTMYDVRFLEGDLIAYIRRENGNEVGAATQFRHLQRLP
jgi:hypothetical protein